MRILWIGLGIVAVIGTGGIAYYFLYADREVASGTQSGFEWRIIKRPGLSDAPGGGTFCAEIRDVRGDVGFARFEGGTFQKLGCHARINLAKGEALEAIINIAVDPSLFELPSPTGTGTELDNLPALDVPLRVFADPVSTTFAGGG